MKHKKFIMISVLVILVLAMVLSACGNNADNTPAASTNGGNNNTNESPADEGILEEVNLNMVLLGSKPADFDIVWDEFNKKLKEKVNATVDVRFLDWSDWGQKYPLIFAAGEDVDIIYTANWAFYSEQAIRGGFMEITDEMLETYAPQTWANMPQVRWEQAKVNNKLYMVPSNNQTEFLNKLVLIREDLRKKYNIPEVNDMDSMANYLLTLAENEPDMYAYASSPQGKGQFNTLTEIILLSENNWRLVDPTLPLAYRYDDPEGKLFNIYETPEYKQLIAYYKILADADVWSRDILSTQESPEFTAGQTGMLSHNLGTMANELMRVQQEFPEYEAALADVTPNALKATAIATQNGMAIHAISKKWERALMVIDLLQNDKELYDLSHYGFVDVHYIPVGDDKFRRGPEADKYGIASWGWWNSDINRQDESYPQEAIDIEQKWAGETYHWPLEIFVLDIEPISTEASAVGQAMIRYGAPLEYGLINDLDQGLASLIEQVKAANLDALQQEAQRQIDEFLAEYN